MNYQAEVNELYFAWLIDVVGGCSNRKETSFSKLLRRLHDIEFRYSIERDGNRAEDGLSLRYRFSCERTDVADAELYLEGPCSVLEMMVALSIRCEEVMDDPCYGDRTSQWFWNMVKNLGLGCMTDARFDIDIVDDAIARMLNREYEPDGTGGLFRVRHQTRDLRDVELWHQLCWSLEDIT